MLESKITMSRAQHMFHALMFIVALVLIAEPTWMPYPKFVKAVGEALIIALAVIYLVELHSHRRLEETAARMIRKVGKNIFGLVYGHELPSALVEALEASTLQQPVYRDRMLLDIELTTAEANRKDGGRERVCRATNLYRFSLINCSENDVPRPLVVSVERDKWLAEMLAEGEADPSIEWAMVGDVLFAEQGQAAALLAKLSLPASTKIVPLAQHLEMSENGNELLFSIPDFVIPQQGRVAVMFHNVLLKRHSDNEVWSSSYPTLGVSLSITSSEFEVEARFPSDTLPATYLGGMSNKWTFDLPLLAGQAVIYWWRPKSGVV